MKLALYTTVYPAVMPLLPVWYASVRAQTYRHVDIWIGTDGLAEARVSQCFGATAPVTVVAAPPASTPAGVRGAALGELVATRTYDAVILADADDLLLPRRVAAARTGLAHVDLVGTAMVLMADNGTPLRWRFGLRCDEPSETPFPGTNVYGFGNSAYRIDWIERLLPAPLASAALDWLWATRVWLGGGRLGFDCEPGICYRQHETHVVPLLPPFDPARLRRTAALVCHHYQLLDAYRHEALPDRWQRLQLAAQRARRFQAAIADAGRLTRYVAALNALGPQRVWWGTVAHPELEDLWNSE